MIDGGLTAAEHRALIPLLKGATATQAAAMLGIKVSTYRAQLHSIYEKTGVRNGHELFGRYLIPGESTRQAAD